MKIKRAASVVFIGLLSTQTLWAKTSMRIIDNYNLAIEKKIWKEEKSGKLPSAILHEVSIENPSHAYSFPYNELFLQNNYFYLCQESCELPQTLPLNGDGDDFSVVFYDSKKRSKKKIDEKSLQQGNVYYWLTRFFTMLEERVGFSMQQRLKVIVGRKTRDLQTGKKDHNNAFYNSLDHSLSFLPERNGLLSKLSGTKLRPSAIDPSVAIHEAGHAVFRKLYGTYLNPEIGGLDEGFADYMAMILLETDKVGSIMMSGGHIRDLSKPKLYRPNMPVHDLGEVFASALWIIRQNLFSDKVLADKIVFKAVEKMGQKLTATALSFPHFYAEALKDSLAAEDTIHEKAKTVWDAVFGSYKLAEVSAEVIVGPITSKGYHTSHFSSEFPIEIAKEYGLPTFQQAELTLIDVRNNPSMAGTKWYLMALTKDQLTTPIWFLYHSAMKVVLDTRDIHSNQINLNDKEMSNIVHMIGENLTSLIDWSESFGKDFGSIVTRNGQLALIYKAKKVKEKATFLPINGKLVPAKIYAAKLRSTLISKILSIFMGGGLKAFDQITFYTVRKGSLPKEEKLLELFDGQLLVGYEVVTKTGVKTKVLLNSYE